MNTNPQAKVILCFGDSNTHGTKPDGNRYPANVRWTGQLQKNLGENFYVIEEGLGGRTTNLDSPDSEKPGRNGWDYFKPCLSSHTPINVLILMLGTNDLKKVFNRSEREIADVLNQYCQCVKEFDPNIKIFLVSPSYITNIESESNYDAESAAKSKRLAPELKQLAQSLEIPFLDAAEFVDTGEDGLHWDEISESKFAETIEKELRQLA